MACKRSSVQVRYPPLDRRFFAQHRRLAPCRSHRRHTFGECLPVCESALPFAQTVRRNLHSALAHDGAYLGPPPHSHRRFQSLASNATLQSLKCMPTSGQPHELGNMRLSPSPAKPSGCETILAMSSPPLAISTAPAGNLHIHHRTDWKVFEAVPRR